MEYIEVLNEAELLDAIQKYGSDSVAMVEFYKDNCPGCRVMIGVVKSYYEDESDSNKATLIKAKLENLGVDVFSDYDVMATPTFIFYHHSKEVHRMHGVNPVERIQKAVHEY